MGFNKAPSNMKLSNDITVVDWQGKTFRAPDTTRVIIEMVAFNLSYRKIAEILGVSHQTINKRVQTFKEEFPDEWEVAKSKESFYTKFKQMYYKNATRFELAEYFLISPSQVDNLITKLIPKSERVHKTMMNNRFDNMAQTIFGYQFKAGEDFPAYILGKIKELKGGDVKSRLIRYVHGDDNVHGPERFKQRSDKAKLQKTLLEENVMELIEEGILCRNAQLN